MLNIWLAASILLPIVITYFVLTDAGGFKKWGSYYVIAVLTFLMYLIRKWMMKRMEKHLTFLEDQKKNK
jgi:hypothetical protein